MFCGTKQDVQKITVWSGVPVWGEECVEGIKLGFIITVVDTGGYQKKVVDINDIRETQYEICTKCDGFDINTYTESERAKEDNREYIARRKPFKQTFSLE